MGVSKIGNNHQFITQYTIGSSISTYDTVYEIDINYIG